MHDHIRQIADAVMYEGYLLYPYRASSVKNRQRWNFGVLYPRAYAEAQRGADRWSLRAECIVTGTPDVDVLLRFIQLTPRPDSTWQEATAREVTAGSFAFAELAGWMETRTESLADGIAGVWKITVDVENRTPFTGDPNDRDAALLRSFASAHVALSAHAGAFVSLLDPPPELAQAVANCKSEGVYPVLVGENAMLASPIILYDHPRIAPESRGDLFDGTEIDEILTLRIMTLTDDEKREACAIDDRARRIIERTDALTPHDLFAMHGRSERSVTVSGTTLRAGDRVRLRPRGKADIMDIALAGKTAVIASIEQDFEDRVHVAVLVDDDPGRDLGASGQPGHRFFFSPEEVEPL